MPEASVIVIHLALACNNYYQLCVFVFPLLLKITNHRAYSNMDVALARTIPKLSPPKGIIEVKVAGLSDKNNENMI